MSDKELVKLTMKGEKANGNSVPSSFSLHFPQEEKFGEKCVEAHLKYFNDTNLEINKIMNENAFPANPGVYQADDFKRLKVQDKTSKFVQDEVELFKRIKDKAGDDKYYLLTIQGAVASLGHSMRPQYGPLSEIRQIQVASYREKPQVLTDAMKKVTESLCNLVEELSNAGADGFYYAVLGGEKTSWTREEAENFIAPFDKLVLKTIKENGKDSVLHLCKKDLDIERFVSYAPYFDCLNWGVYENGISLEDGIRLFPGKTIMGGLENRGGILEKGSENEIHDEVIRVRKIMKGVPFILGADCTLSTDIDRKNIRIAAEAARERI